MINYRLIIKLLLVITGHEISDHAKLIGRFQIFH